MISRFEGLGFGRGSWNLVRVVVLKARQDFCFVWIQVTVAKRECADKSTGGLFTREEGLEMEMKWR